MRNEVLQISSKPCMDSLTMNAYKAVEDIKKSLIVQPDIIIQPQSEEPELSWWHKLLSNASNEWLDVPVKTTSRLAMMGTASLVSGYYIKKMMKKEAKASEKTEQLEKTAKRK